METGLKTQQEKCTIIGLHLKVSLRGTGVRGEGDYDEEELEGDYEEEETVGGGTTRKRSECAWEEGLRGRGVCGRRELR